MGNLNSPTLYYRARPVASGEKARRRCVLPRQSQLKGDTDASILDDVKIVQI
jgi:hypothetical protein